MILSEHSLRQIDEPYIRSLSEKPCQDLAVKLLFDLKAVHERLNQNPTNSSMPPSSRLAWVTNDSFGDESKDEEQGKGIGAEVETCYVLRNSRDIVPRSGMGAGWRSWSLLTGA